MNRISLDRVEVIAEAGVNHNGSLDMALELIDVAAASGASVVKFQTFKAAKLVSRSAEKADYQKSTTGSSESQLEMVRKLEMSDAAHVKMRKHCKARNIGFMSTPFDEESVDFLVRDLGVDRLKVPSGEITNGPLLLKMARTGLPILLSTGMATLGEIERALGVLAFGMIHADRPPASEGELTQSFSCFGGQRILRDRVKLLHCTTEYPAPFEDINLRAIQTMASAFGLPVGFSDHSEGINVPIASVAFGAVVIEKHFTLDRNLPGPDHRASLEPEELKAMVEGIRQIEAALGDSRKIPAASEWKNVGVARRSLVAAHAISRGEMFTEANLTAKRPGLGMSPMLYWSYLGRRAERDYALDEMIAE